MGYKTPLSSANAFFLVQILLMELFNMGLLVVKPPPMHLKRIFDLHQKRFCALRLWTRNGSILIVSKVIVKVVASIFCQFAI